MVSAFINTACLNIVSSTYKYGSPMQLGNWETWPFPRGVSDLSSRSLHPAALRYEYQSVPAISSRLGSIRER